jgi:hypothetical protein
MGSYPFSWYLKQSFGFMQNLRCITVVNACLYAILWYSMRYEMTIDGDRDMPELQ